MQANAELVSRPLQPKHVARRGVVGWPLVALLALANAVWLLLSFADTVLATVAIWLRSETYAHGLLVVPIAAFLVWRERRAVQRLDPRPSFLGLVAFSVWGGLWLVARLANVEAAQQFAVVFMFVTGAWALLGTEVVRRLWFPLAFLVFAVPIGDFLLPPLMNFTADFTVASLRLTGIPVYREGNMFQLPSGSWSVVEACSGLRYLIASLTLGALYAYLSYRSAWKRMLFVLFSVFAPILANGMRAYFIVMLGHLSDMKLAVGVDHLIYGWVFFGLVMMLMFWVGSLWRDPPVAGLSNTPGVPPEVPVPLARPTFALPLMALAIAAVSSFWPAYSLRMSDRYIKAAPHLSTPRPVGDWQLAAQPPVDWEPQFRFERASLVKTFAKGDRVVTVNIKYYRHQVQDLEMINSANMIASSRSPWHIMETKPTSVHLAGHAASIRETRLRSKGGEVLVWHWFNVGQIHTGSEALAKLATAHSRITEGSDDAAAVFLWAPINERGVPASEVLADFVGAMWGSIDETLRRAKP